MINGVGGIVGDGVEEEEDADGRVECGKGKLGRGMVGEEIEVVE